MINTKSQYRAVSRFAARFSTILDQLDQDEEQKRLPPSVRKSLIASVRSTLNMLEADMGEFIELTSSKISN